MRFACTQENFSQGLTLVCHIATKSAHLPILNHVCLKADNGSLKLSATNLELAISTVVRGRMDEAGECAIPAKLLQDAVSLFPTGKIELTVHGDELELSAEGQSTRIKGMLSAEFPLIPKLVKEIGYRLSAPALREAIARVVFAVSTSESRPELAGVSCVFSHEDTPDTLTLASTDSYRLAESHLPVLPNGSRSPMRCIVPARTMQEIQHILGSYKDDLAQPDDLEWSLSESQLVISYGSVELISRLIEGSFPDYQQIIPRQFRTDFRVKRSELAKAIRAASLFARQGIFDILFDVLEDGSLCVSSANTGIGTHRTTLHVEGTTSANQVTLNYKFLADGLSAIATEHVSVQMVDATNPVVLRPVGQETYQYIVMPIRG